MYYSNHLNMAGLFFPLLVSDHSQVGSISFFLFLLFSGGFITSLASSETELLCGENAVGGCRE